MYICAQQLVNFIILGSTAVGHGRSHRGSTPLVLVDFGARGKPSLSETFISSHKTNQIKLLGEVAPLENVLLSTPLLVVHLQLSSQGRLGIRKAGGEAYSEGISLYINAPPQG